MTGLILVMVLAALVVFGCLLLDHLVSTREHDRIEEDVNSAHLNALQTAQRIHTLTWRARQALFDEARRSGNGQ